MRAYTLSFAWEDQPPAVWISFDVDAVLPSAAAYFGQPNPSSFACPLVRQKMWLTTVDMELVQRVIACDMMPQWFLNFLAVPGWPPWDVWLPERKIQADHSARKGLMGSLESWMSVHAGPAQWALQPSPWRPPSGALRRLSWSCKRTCARARAWGARLRVPGAEERVFISHLSGVCVVTHVAVPGHGLRQGGGGFRGQPNEQMIKAGKLSSVTVNSFCYQDVLSQRDGAWVAAWEKEWRCHADGKDLVVPCWRSEGAQPAPEVSLAPLDMVRIFHLHHYGNDLQLVVGPGGASRGHNYFDQTNQEDASTKILRTRDCRPFHRRHSHGTQRGNQ